MPKVLGVDHLTLSVSDFQRSRAFYDPLLKFLGFEVLGEYGDMMGWYQWQDPPMDRPSRRPGQGLQIPLP